MSTAQRLNDIELRAELEAQGVRCLTELRRLGIKLGIPAALPKTNAAPRAPQLGLWAHVVKMMRRDCGVTEAEADRRVSEQTGGDRSQTIATNLTSLCMLCGGRKAGEGSFSIKRIKHRRRGRVYSLLTFARRDDREGILNEVVKCLLRPEGASGQEVIAHLYEKFPDHCKQALRGTAGTHLSIWASILPKRGAQADFTMSAGHDGKPVFRVS